MRILSIFYCVFGVAWTNPSVSKWWRWDDSTVIYGTLLDSQLTTKIEEVMKMYSAQTCINFKYDNTSATGFGVWLDHYYGRNCGQAFVSRVDRQSNAKITISPNCWTGGTIAHEIGHSIGFSHTQARNDRDTYLDTIHRGEGYENISYYYTDEFASQDNFEIPYDYGSMLHYSEGPFQVKDRRYQNTVGQRTDISFYDLLAVNRFYECTCPTSSVACENGGYPNPRNCAVCNCPVGFGGATCTERPTTCGEEFTATADWQEYTGTFNYSDGRNNSMQASDCVHWIKAPPGKGISIEITCKSMAGVAATGLEIMVEDDLRKSGVRVGRDSPPEVSALGTKRSILPVRLYIGRRWDIETNKYVWGDIQKYTFRYKIDGISPISTTITPTTSTPPATTSTTTSATTATWTTTASTSPTSPTTVETATTSTLAVTTPPTTSESETTTTDSDYPVTTASEKICSTTTEAETTTKEGGTTSDAQTTSEVPEESTTDVDQHSTEPTPADETTTVQTEGSTTEKDC